MGKSRGELLSSIAKDLKRILKDMDDRRIRTFPMVDRGLVVRGMSVLSIDMDDLMGSLEIGRGKLRISMDSGELATQGAVIEIFRRWQAGDECYLDTVWHLKAIGFARDGVVLRSCYYLVDTDELEVADLVKCIACAVSDLGDLKVVSKAVSNISWYSSDFKKHFKDIGYSRGEDRSEWL